MDAVLPLIGVVVGAILGSGTTYLLEKRREGRAAKAGLRLLVHELEGTKLRWHNLTTSWDSQPTAENADRLISDLKKRPYATTLWTNHQEVLASSLSRADWEDLANAYALIAFVESAVQDADATVEDQMELPDVMKDAERPLDAILRRLQQRAGISPSTG